jgi:hypothetical protein
MPDNPEPRLFKPEAELIRSALVMKRNFMETGRVDISADDVKSSHVCNVGLRALSMQDLVDIEDMNEIIAECTKIINTPDPYISGLNNNRG